MFLDIKNVLTNNYDKKNFKNDLALVELKDGFKWSDKVLPACLATSDYVPKYKGVLMVRFKV